jgi:type 1 glutamine amidotransferase
MPRASASPPLRPSWLALVVLVLFAAGRGRATNAEPPQTPPKKILFIGKNPDHAFGTHMYMHTSGMLGRCAELTPGVQAVVSNGWPQDAATLARVSSIVVYTNPAAELLLDGEHRGQVDALMRGGCGLVTIHWASSVNQKNLDRLGPAWLGYLGGTWVSNVGLSGGTSPLRQLIPDHPVCRGWKEWEITDEYYLNPTIAEAQPLLEVTEKNGTKVIVGWVFERPGGGRSFATTLGHPYKNFEHESFRRMLVNGILWTAGVAVPAAGAPVNVPAAVLALPPAPDPAPPTATPAPPQPAAAK